jgi:YesN/AraC family two-component response regulator
MCRAFFSEKLLESNRNFAVSGTIPSVNILESFITGIVRRWFFERDDKSDTLADEITQYVYRKGGTAVTVEELAKYLGYSTGYLRILARQKCGDSTKILIDKARIRVAKKMLLYSDMRINELSDTMGFADWKYFSRFFRKYTGMSPREYVKSKR